MALPPASSFSTGHANPRTRFRQQYADDAASESAGVIVLACVVGKALRVVHRGWHYGAGAPGPSGWP